MSLATEPRGGGGGLGANELLLPRAAAAAACYYHHLAAAIAGGGGSAGAGRPLKTSAPASSGEFGFLPIWCMVLKKKEIRIRCRMSLATKTRGRAGG